MGDQAEPLWLVQIERTYVQTYWHCLDCPSMGKCNSLDSGTPGMHVRLHGHAVDVTRAEVKPLRPLNLTPPK